MEKPDDRPQKSTPGEPAEPKVFLLVDGQQFPRPALETFFAETSPQQTDPACSCHPVTGVYCSCNKVTTCSCVPVCGCVSVCSCVGHSSCSCVGHSSGGGGYGCRCAPVH